MVNELKEEERSEPSPVGEGGSNNTGTRPQHGPNKGHKARRGKELTS